VEAARDELGAITRALDEATALATAGKLAEATAAARPLRERSLALASRVAALSATPAR
jgi:soluble cytochrome b562